MTPRAGDPSRLPVVRTLLPGLALIAACLGAAACAPPRVPLPDSARPDVVARAYLDALVAGDCTATRALLAHDDNPAMNDLCGIGRVDAYRGLTAPTGTATDVRQRA